MDIAVHWVKLVLLLLLLVAIYDYRLDFQNTHSFWYSAVGNVSACLHAHVIFTREIMSCFARRRDVMLCAFWPLSGRLSVRLSVCHNAVLYQTDAG